jgi:hypothetical protein
MKISIMLRHLGQHGGGVLVYTHNLLREMLALNTSHEFVLLYREPCWLGPFSNGNKGRVREMALGKSPTIIWGQWLVPQTEKKKRSSISSSTPSTPFPWLPDTRQCSFVMALIGM